MIWKSDNARVALLELLSRGTLRRRQSQSQAYNALAELPWTRATGRRDEIGVVEERRGELTKLIGRVWPAWPDVLAELAASGLPLTPEGLSKLQDRKRAATLPDLPPRINRHTAAALAAPHSKATLTGFRRQALGEATPTHDGSVRLRPPTGLVVRTNRGVVDLSATAEILGEVSIPERAFLDKLTFEGPIRAALLVENLGAWRDLPHPPGWLLVHVPGWDTATTGHLFDQLTTTPIVHFGDVDPNGVRILLHLRQRVPSLKWFLPDFWFDQAGTTALQAAWPPELDLSFAPARVQKLADSNRWLEQERVVLDPRILDALEKVLAEGDSEI